MSEKYKFDDPDGLYFSWDLGGLFSKYPSVTYGDNGSYQIFLNSNADTIITGGSGRTDYSLITPDTIIIIDVIPSDILNNLNY